MHVPAVIVIVFAAAGLAHASPNVALRDDPGAALTCGIRDCTAAYQTFVARHPNQTRPRDPAAIDAALAAADAAPLPGPTGLSAAEVRDAVRKAIGTEFLWDDLDARQLTVTTVAARDAGAYVERRVVFDDPEVGAFDALVLEPPGRHRVPAIVGLHGHLDTPDVFAGRYLGRELAAAGYLVVMPQLRAMDCLGPVGPEGGIARALLEGGFTLIGLRAYEAALAAKYLRALPRVDGARIGLLTHSGGSSTGDIAVRMTDAFAAHVVDYHQDWRNRCDIFESLHCETVPALVPLQADLAADTGAPLPRLGVPYRFEDPATRREILRFFERQLHDFDCPRLDPPACDGQPLSASLTDGAAKACATVRIAEGSRAARRRALAAHARSAWRRFARGVRRETVSPECGVTLRAELRAAAAQRGRRRPGTRN